MIVQKLRHSPLGTAQLKMLNRYVDYKKGGDPFLMQNGVCPAGCDSIPQGVWARTEEGEYLGLRSFQIRGPDGDLKTLYDNHPELSTEQFGRAPSFDILHFNGDFAWLCDHGGNTFKYPISHLVVSHDDIILSEEEIEAPAEPAEPQEVTK